MYSTGGRHYRLCAGSRTTFTRLYDAIAVTLFPGDPRGDKYRMCVADRQIRLNSLSFIV